MWIVRINMTDRSYKVEDVPEKYAKLGGRGITSMIVADEVPPLAHPLGPNNKLVIAPGLLSGTAAPTLARASTRSSRRSTRSSARSTSAASGRRASWGTATPASSSTTSRDAPAAIPDAGAPAR